MKRLALISALLLLAAPQARAAEPVPGDACGTAPYVTNTWQTAGGKENGGVVNSMFCDGAHWKGIINFQSSGKVGIGTASPAFPLQVVQNSAGAGENIMAQNQNAGGYAELGGLDLGGGLQFVLGYGNGSTSAPYNTTYLFFGSPSWNIVNGPNVAIATFMGSGNFGIGTTGPATKLDVNGDITNENVKSCAQLGTDSTGKLVCQTPAMVLISTKTASNSASIQFSGSNFSNSYNTLFLNCSGLLMSVGGAKIASNIGEGAGPTWETAAHYTNAGDATSTGTDLFDGNWPFFNVTTPVSMKFYIDNPGSSSVVKQFWGTEAGGLQSSTGIYSNTNGWWNGDTNPVTGWELVGIGGTIKSGTCSLYGMN